MVWNPAMFMFRYATHEAADWSDIHQRWFFLPRRLSLRESWEPDADGMRGCKVLISCTDDFTDIKITQVEWLNLLVPFRSLRKNLLLRLEDLGELLLECFTPSLTFAQIKMEDTPERGFSAMRFVPGSRDRHIIATQTVEGSEGDCSSYLMVLDLDGNVLMSAQHLGNHKSVVTLE